MNRTFTVCAAVLMAGLAGCNQSPAPTASAGTSSSNHDADVQAIKDTEKQWNQDYMSKDATKLATHYTDDAVLMTPGEGAMVGKDAIQKGLQQMVSDPALSLKFEATNVEVASSGDLGYTRGTYTLTMTDPHTKKPMTDHGSYVTDYKKQSDGTWKAVADIATSEVPMAPAVPTMIKKK